MGRYLLLFASAPGREKVGRTLSSSGSSSSESLTLLWDEEALASEEEEICSLGCRVALALATALLFSVFGGASGCSCRGLCGCEGVWVWLG